MKYIMLGIKDYCKDCWHDWLSNRLHKVQGERIYTYDAEEDQIYWLFPWKKGSVWHYMQYHRLKQKIKEIAKLKKEYEEQKQKEKNNENI